MQAIIEVDRLDQYPVFKQLCSVTFINSLLQTILPGLPFSINIDST